MKYLLAISLSLAFLLSGCTRPETRPLVVPAPVHTSPAPVPPGAIPVAQNPLPVEPPAVPAPTLYWPMTDFTSRITFKKFGQEVHDRFNGFHVADDGEVTADEIKTEIPIYVIADGRVIYRRFVSGYGGLLILEHELDGKTINSLYGHIDLSQVVLKVGDEVLAGSVIAYLGDHKTTETDGERKHLHFGMYEATRLRINGYAQDPKEIDEWIHPSEYLREHEAAEPGLLQ